MPDTNEMIFKTELVPAIVQDVKTGKVLMLGYFNEASYRKTVETGRVTFYSRSRQRLWTKGESSGNFLQLVDMKLDCDEDTFLVKVKPYGVVCHTGADTCWGESNESSYGFLSELETTIGFRRENKGDPQSYIASLFRKGINKISQKVGEEAVEVVIEAKDRNPKLFLNESADLLFHYLILLQAKDFTLKDVVRVLEDRSVRDEAKRGLK